MKTTLFVVTIALLLSLAGNWYFWNEKNIKEFESTMWELQAYDYQHDLVKHRATAQTAARRADSLQASFEIRHVKDSLALIGLKMRNKAKSKKVDSLRIPVQPLIDSIQALGAFVQAYDSLLAGKNEEIKQLEQRHIGQILDLHAILKEKTSQIMAQIAVSETLGQVVTNLETENKRQRRGKKFFQWTTGIAVGVGLYLAVKE